MTPAVSQPTMTPAINSPLISDHSSTFHSMIYQKIISFILGLDFEIFWEGYGVNQENKTRIPSRLAAAILAPLDRGAMMVAVKCDALHQSSGFPLGESWSYDQACDLVRGQTATSQAVRVGDSKPYERIEPRGTLSKVIALASASS